MTSTGVSTATPRTAGRVVARIESWTLRDLARMLALTLVTCVAGTIIGPVIGGTWGNLWGYISGGLGPIVLWGLVFCAWPFVVRLWWG